MLSVGQKSELEEIVGCEPQNQPEMTLDKCLDGYLNGNAFVAKHPCKDCPIGRIRRREYSSGTGTQSVKRTSIF